MCGKEIYNSEREAAEVLGYLKRVSHRSHIPKRYYYCKQCKGFHFTSLGSEKKFRGK